MISILVADKEEPHPEGAYYLEWYEGSRRVRLSVGEDAGAWPRYVEDEPEIYEREELNKFFAACKDDDRLWFEFFPMTGFAGAEGDVLQPGPKLTLTAESGRSAINQNLDFL